MKSYQLLKQLRIEQEKNTAAAATGYFDYKYEVKPPKTAAQLETLVQELINRSGGCVSIIYTGGRALATKTEASNVLGHKRSMVGVKHITGSTRKGTPDVLGVFEGKPLAVEIKFSTGDRMSPHQQAYKKQWEAAGGTFIICRTLDDLLEII